MGGALLSQPWRDLPKSNYENLNFVSNYEPQNNNVKHLRVLLHGPAGAGKSSFVNSVDSVLHGKASSRALTDATSGSSFTLKHKAYKIRKDQESFYSVIFNDIMGFEQNTDNGVCVEDVILALKGHVKEGYQFIPQCPMAKNDSHYNSTPTLDDRVHVLVSVIPANSSSLLSDKVMKKMREVRLAASDLGIPQLAILTKVDEACPEVKKDIKNVYKSEYLKERVDLISQLLGPPPNCIFLVKNYESEININDEIDKLILVALRQMVNFGEDFLNNQ